jgi:hypothetical protein
MHGVVEGARAMPTSVDPNPELEATLSALSRARIQELRDRWRATFRSDPPKAFGPDLLRRGIAYRLQEQRYGGLSMSVRRQLNQLIKVLTKKSTSHIELPKRVKTGAVLMRLWKGKSHRVAVLDDGFAFEGRVHNSLSEIAREITGTRWNGPRFSGCARRSYPNKQRNHPNDADDLQGLGMPHDHQITASAALRRLHPKIH